MIRLRELRLEKGLSLRELANTLDISFSSVSKYERSEAQPSFDILIKIADFFNVSIDYLIGYSDIRTKDVEIKTIAERTGLSIRSLEQLMRYVECSNNKEHNSSTLCSFNLKTINILLGSPYDLLDHISDYLFFSATHFKNFYKDGNSELAPISELQLWDDVNKTSYSDDWDLWTNALLLTVEKDLIYLRDTFQSEKSRDYYKNEAPTD